jgi:hypothetical protein
VIRALGARVRPGRLCAFQPPTQPQTVLHQAHGYPTVSRSCRSPPKNQDLENLRGRMYHPLQLLLRSSYGNGWRVEMTEAATVCSVRGSVVYDPMKKENPPCCWRPGYRPICWGVFERPADWLAVLQAGIFMRMNAIVGSGINRIKMQGCLQYASYS